MKARLWRWAKRVFFGLIVVVGVFTALYLIAATLFSNMIHSDKISLYIIIGYALCCYLRGRWRTFFATKPASPGAETADEDVGEVVADDESETDVVVLGTMHDDVSIISSDALASLTRGQNKVAQL